HHIALFNHHMFSGVDLLDHQTCEGCNISTIAERIHSREFCPHATIVSNRFIVGSKILPNYAKTLV
ncbi:MAG: hypothetical protein ACK451_16755, partial [Pseudanabaena sp.]